MAYQLRRKSGPTVVAGLFLHRPSVHRLKFVFGAAASIFPSNVSRRHERPNGLGVGGFHQIVTFVEFGATIVDRRRNRQFDVGRRSTIYGHDDLFEHVVVGAFAGYLFV